MSQLPDGLSLGQISIPGTHDPLPDSPLGSIGPTGQTQSQSLSDQLNSGVRFIDIRLGNNIFVTAPDLECVHADISLGLSFNTNVVPVCENFLSINPNETIVMSIKPDGDGTNAPSTAQVDTLVQSHVFGSDSNYWYSGNSIPTLGEVRGKIVILDRWSGSLGITSSWDDDTQGTPASGNKNLYVEDYYNNGNDSTTLFSAILQKETAISQTLAVVENTPITNPTWYLTFTSAAQDDAAQIFNGYNPKSFADSGTIDGYGVGINYYLENQLSGLNAARLGTVIADFAVAIAPFPEVMQLF